MTTTSIALCNCLFSVCWLVGVDHDITVGCCHNSCGFQGQSELLVNSIILMDGYVIIKYTCMYAFELIFIKQ